MRKADRAEAEKQIEEKLEELRQIAVEYNIRQLNIGVFKNAYHAFSYQGEREIIDVSKRF